MKLVSDWWKTVKTRCFSSPVGIVLELRMHLTEYHISNLFSYIWLTESKKIFLQYFFVRVSYRYFRSVFVFNGRGLRTITVEIELDRPQGPSSTHVRRGPCNDATRREVETQFRLMHWKASTLTYTYRNKLLLKNIVSTVESAELVKGRTGDLSKYYSTPSFLCTGWASDRHSLSRLQDVFYAPAHICELNAREALQCHILMIEPQSLAGTF